MKLGLIKKSMICLLSLSFALTLASCGKTSNEKITSTTNVFTNKEILAYAKKYRYQKEEKEVNLREFDVDAYTISWNYEKYALLFNNSTSVYYLYIKATNQLVSLENTDSEYISNISVESQVGSRYGYYVISYSNGEKMVIDFNGNKIIPRGTISNLTFNRYGNTSSNKKGEALFYDVINYRESSNDKKDIYKISAKMNEDDEITDYTRDLLTSSDEIDYSAFAGQNDTYALKSYDLSIDGSSIIVKDLKGNLKSTFAFDINCSFYALDDKIFYQTEQNVTVNDDYTFTANGNYYLLKTYTVDLNTGITTQIKDYDYYLIDVISDIYAYNEKDDREYVGAVYASLEKIVDKRLSGLYTNAMVDKNGKILSNKIGEKGINIIYLNDKTYILNDNPVTTILDSKGKIKTTYYNRNVYIDYENELIYMPISSGSNQNAGYYLDTDLKVYEYAGVSTYTSYARFDNGNAIFSTEDGIGLVKVENKKVVEIERYDMDNFGTSFTPSKTIVEGYKYVKVNDYLTANNLYIVQIKTSTGWDMEIHSQTGETLKTIQNVTNIQFYSNSTLFMRITTATTNYYYGASMLSSNAD